MNVGVFSGDDENNYAGFNFSRKLVNSPEIDLHANDAKYHVPIHLQLVERSEYMRRLEVNESTSSLGSLTPSSSSSADSRSDASASPYMGKHRYSTYYERLPFFKNPFSPHNKKTQKLSYTVSAISPDSSKFVLVSNDKWLVYGIRREEPKLLCCGRINGDHGCNFDSLHKEPKLNMATGSKKAIKYKSCTLSERLLVLSCTDGSIRIHDVLDNGKLFFQYEVGLPIESLAISPKNDIVACGLQGRNKQTRGTIMLLITFDFQQRKMGQGLSPEILAKLTNLQSQGANDFAPPQPPNFLRKLSSKSSLKSLKKASEKQNEKPLSENSTVSEPFLDLKLIKSDTKLITLPYKGIVDNVKFSPKGDKLIISTFKSESKFVVFDVTVPLEIKLIMKSSRTPTTSVLSEGITDFQLFGSHDQYMVITSNSTRAPPMILNSKIDTKDFNIDDKPVQPTKLLKLDSIGANVHKCCINSTNNLASFLTTDGKIWLAHLTNDFQIKNLEIIDKVSGSSCYKNTAAINFSKDGTKMYIVDLKGVMYVQDFSTILKRKF